MEDKIKQPSEEEQQWLKDLFAQAEAPKETDLPEAAAPSEEEQWLQELFASAEQAAEQEFQPEKPLPQEPEKTEEPELLQPMPVLESTEDAIAQDTAAPEEMPELIQDNSPAPVPEETASEVTEPEIQAQPADEAPEEADEVEEEDRQPTKRRPRNTQSHGLFGLPHLVVTGVWIAIILAIGVFLGQWLWKGASDVLAFGREEKLVTITITKDDDLDSLIDKLESAGLIQEPMWFRLYAQITDVMEDIGTGTYELNTLFDYRALVAHMSPNSAARVTVSVRIPEGANCAQIFQLLEDKGICSVEDLEMAAIGGDLQNYWFLEDVDRNDKYCLEGYLFPDTYEFYISDNATRVLNALLDNFDIRFTDIMRSKLEVLNQTMAEKMRANGMTEAEIQARQFTIREVVVIASLIEKEATGASEGYFFSSMIYNQLTHPSKHPHLEMKRPLMYVTGRTELTDADYLLDSPYNTFLNPGLIPSPICNPSRTSLDAALDPSQTDYYYFAYNPETNSHHFFNNEKAWQEFIDQLPQEEENP